MYFTVSSRWLFAHAVELDLSLVEELKTATQELLLGGETVILDDTQGVVQLCFVLEKILNNGLKGIPKFTI